MVCVGVSLAQSHVGCRATWRAAAEGGWRRRVWPPSQGPAPPAEDLVPPPAAVALKPQGRATRYKALRVPLPPHGCCQACVLSFCVALSVTSPLFMLPAMA